LLRRFASRNDDDGHEISFPRRHAPEFCVKFRALKSEGAGKTGCALHPRSRVQSGAKNAHEHTGSAEANRKAKHRKGRVQLIDATRHFVKMGKSLGNKRNELSNEQIEEITKVYSAFKDDAKCKVVVDGKPEDRICSKIFDNRDFGFIKLVVERPLRLNFQTLPERIARLSEQSAFAALAESKKRKSKTEISKEVAAGKKEQIDIIKALSELDSNRLFKNRDTFKKALDVALDDAGLNVTTAVYKAILVALSERDPKADTCTDANGNYEADPDLRSTESIVLPRVPLPLPIEYKSSKGKEPDNKALIKLVRKYCDEYFAREVAPHSATCILSFRRLFRIRILTSRNCTPMRGSCF
jgi:type I restriction enzyme M protein